MDPRMEIARAKEIVKALADGRDPATGEPFPPGSPYQQADTVRALYLALDALDNAARRAQRQANRPQGAPGSPDLSGRSPAGQRPIDPNRPKVGAPWSPEEEQRLRDAFAANKPIQAIALDHGRYPGAITARLVKLGLIEDNPTNRSGRGHAPSAGLSRRSPPTAEPDRGTNTPPPAAAQFSPPAPPTPPPTGAVDDGIPF